MAARFEPKFLILYNLVTMSLWAVSMLCLPCQISFSIKHIILEVANCVMFLYYLKY